MHKNALKVHFQPLRNEVCFLSIRESYSIEKVNCSQMESELKKLSPHYDFFKFFVSSEVSVLCSLGYLLGCGLTVSHILHPTGKYVFHNHLQ